MSLALKSDTLTVFHPQPAYMAVDGKMRKGGFTTTVKKL